jgi:membrane protease YdiL (CAAX protease family)
LAVSATLCAVVSAISRSGVLATIHPTLVVLAWLGPSYLLLEVRRRDPFEALALSARPLHLATASLALLLLPIYAAGWLFLFQTRGASLQAPSPSGAGWAMLWNLVFVALPEEGFFRGALQPSLAPARPWLSVVLTSVAFALCHLALDPLGEGPSRLLVFFPSLVFGWLRVHTGSTLAPITFHALANVTNSVVREAVR